MKILVADSVPDRVIEILKADPSWEIVNLPKTKGKVADEIRDADALLVRSATKVTAELLESAKRLVVIGRAGVGVDNVDLDAATRKGVLVMNTPGGNAISVAEHTMTLLLAIGASGGAGRRLDEIRASGRRRSLQAANCATRRWA